MYYVQQPQTNPTPSLPQIPPTAAAAAAAMSPPPSSYRTAKPEIASGMYRVAAPGGGTNSSRCHRLVSSRVSTWGTHRFITTHLNLWLPRLLLPLLMDMNMQILLLPLLLLVIVRFITLSIRRFPRVVLQCLKLRNLGRSRLERRRPYKKRKRRRVLEGPYTLYILIHFPHFLEKYFCVFLYLSIADNKELCRALSA